jgi:hypothetical protein
VGHLLLPAAETTQNRNRQYYKKHEFYTDRILLGLPTFLLTNLPFHPPPDPPTHPPTHLPAVEPQLPPGDDPDGMLHRLVLHQVPAVDQAAREPSREPSREPLREPSESRYRAVREPFPAVGQTADRKQARRRREGGC